MSVEDRHSPTALRISFKKSKTDQYGNGVDVYVIRINSPLCPVGVRLDYVAACGSNPGSFFRFSNGDPLTNLSLHKKFTKSCKY